MPELLVVATTAALDTRDLVRALDRATPPTVGVRAAPGLLAEGDPGEGLVADGARARAATVLVVAPGGPDLANHALLTAAAARDAGLPVPAVVVVGPGGTAERATLRAHAMTDVVELADLQAPMATVAGWPLATWLGAEPVRASAAGVALIAYGPWVERPAPDPRDGDRAALAELLAEVVAAEGPVLATRAYGLVNRAAGNKKLTSVVRAPLSGTAYRLRQQGVLAIDGEGEGEVLRLLDAPAVRVRELGPRTLDEVPTAELVELMRRLAEAGAQDLRRAVLDAYGLRRMTAHADALLAAAEQQL